ncbi:hypothetical protein D6779_01290 [Candidatus Parcubacteria bacterium]|nr:MAG: hypothetical protein D6779_01290 [Candidatus Parcubacteria bacterium]
MSVLLEALKKAAEKRAASEDATAPAASEDGQVAGHLMDGAASGLEAAAESHVQSGSGVSISQETEAENAASEDTEPPSPIEMPLKIKLPVEPLANEDKGGVESADVQRSSESAEGHASASAAEVAASHDGLSETDHAGQVNGSLEQNAEPDFHAGSRFLPVSEVAEQEESSGSAGGEEGAASSLLSPTDGEAQLKLAATDEQVIEPGEDWTVPENALHDDAAGDDVEFVSSPPTSSEASEHVTHNLESSATSQTGSEEGRSAPPLEDPGILVKQKKSWYRISPSLLLLVLLVFTTLIALMWGFYQQSGNRVLPVRYTHVADKYALDMKDLQQAASPIANDGVHHPGADQNVTVEAEEGAGARQNVTRSAHRGIPPSPSSPSMPGKTEKAALTSRQAGKSASDTASVRNTHPPSRGRVMHKQTRAERKAAHEQHAWKKAYPTVKGESTQGTSAVTVDRCFEQLVQTGRLEEGCGRIANPALVSAFKAYQTFRDGNALEAWKQVRNAYSRAPYNVFVVQIYALIGGGMLPVSQLASFHDLFPGSVIVALQLANRYAMSGDKAKALNVLTDSLKEQPQNGYLLYNAALLSYETGNLKMARHLLQQIPAEQLQSDLQLKRAVQQLEVSVRNG